MCSSSVGTEFRNPRNGARVQARGATSDGEHMSQNPNKPSSSSSSSCSRRPGEWGCVLLLLQYPHARRRWRMRPQRGSRALEPQSPCSCEHARSSPPYWTLRWGTPFTRRQTEKKFPNERAPMLHLIAVFFLTTWCAFAFSSDGRCVCSLTERVQAPAVDQLQRWCIKKTDRSVCCLAILHVAPSPSPLPPISIHSPHLAAKALHSQFHRKAGEQVLTLSQGNVLRVDADFASPRGNRASLRVSCFSCASVLRTICQKLPDVFGTKVLWRAL